MDSVFAEIGFGQEGRAPYAVQPDETRGRLFPEPSSPTRTDFQRDRDRVIHSTSFRRLKHKTQVFIYHEGDLFRTRLTHSIEVAQIARSIARALRLDEDLAEALALAHDLGHTPFGHAGEDALAECMEGYQGFEHNAQTLRLVAVLEQRYAEFDGLNLSWETLEGIVKHNGPLIDENGQPFGRYADGLPFGFEEYRKSQDLWLHTYASLEAQAAAISDDVAYNAHDVDDGLRAGLFKLDDLREVEFFAGLLDEIDDRYPQLEDVRKGHELVRRIITRTIEDVIRNARRNISECDPKNVDDVRHAGRTLVEFSPEIQKADKAIKAFLFERMYRQKDVLAKRDDAKGILVDLFHRYFENPSLMSPDWASGLTGNEPEQRARRVCDYVAGMTDRFAVEEHRRLFDVTPDLG